MIRFVNGDAITGDLEKIVATYSRMLVSMYHARIEYPEPAGSRGRQTVADTNHQPSGA